MYFSTFWQKYAERLRAERLGRSQPCRAMTNAVRPSTIAAARAAISPRRKEENSSPRAENSGGRAGVMVGMAVGGFEVSVGNAVSVGARVGLGQAVAVGEAVFVTVAVGVAVRVGTRDLVGEARDDANARRSGVPVPFAGRLKDWAAGVGDGAGVGVSTGKEFPAIGRRTNSVKAQPRWSSGLSGGNRISSQSPLASRP
jgi:hypothetical protein